MGANIYPRSPNVLCSSRILRGIVACGKNIPTVVALEFCCGPDLHKSDPLLDELYCGSEPDIRIMSKIVTSSGDFTGERPRSSISRVTKCSIDLTTTARGTSKRHQSIFLQ